MSILHKVFFGAITKKRPANSLEEGMFVARLASLLPISMIDGAGNLHVDLTELASPPSTTLFTSHTDTVHYEGGVNKYTVEGNFVKADGDVLGADDGAGVALMCYMIEHKVPGMYCFFRGEERGGIGSRYLADTHPELLQKFDRAIAFDRAGYYDVITHQAGGRGCSDEFAAALAGELSDEKIWMMPSSAGVYTDTSEFTGLVPECTNLSVGYKKQHSRWEEQDMEFLEWLASRLVLVKWESLPTVRERPTNKEMDFENEDEYYGILGTEEKAAGQFRVSEMVHEIKSYLAGEENSGILKAIVANCMEVYYGVPVRMDMRRLTNSTCKYLLMCSEMGMSLSELAEMIYNETAVV